MTDNKSAKSIALAMLSTAKGKLISALMIVFLLLGIASESISLVTGYYNMLKTQADAASAGAEARAKTVSGSCHRWKATAFRQI